MSTKKTLAVFVVMPRGSAWDTAYSHGILPAAEAIDGWSVYFDRPTPDRGTMTQLPSIQASIANSDVVMVDLSGSSTGVAFELGIAVTLQKEVVLLLQESKPLDDEFSGMTVIRYDPDQLDRLCNAVVGELSRRVDRIQRKPAMGAIGPAAPSLWLDPANVPRPSTDPAAASLRAEGRELRDKGQLEAAEAALLKAVSLDPQFYEARYELATVKRFLKDDDCAEALALDVIRDAEPLGDRVFLYKSYNLLSGIALRRGNTQEALRHIRDAYNYSSMVGPRVHIAVLKNRFVLEWTSGNRANFPKLYAELREHPDYKEIKQEITRELGFDIDDIADETKGSR